MTEPGRPRRKWKMYAVAGVLLAGSLIAALAVTTRGGPGSGAFSIGGEIDGEGGFRSGFQRDVGQLIGYGFTLGHNTGKRPIKLLGASLLPESESGQAIIVDLRVERLHRGLAGVMPWPDKETGRSDGSTDPLEGYVVPPGGYVEIYFIVKLQKPGRTDWTRTRVAYEEDGTERVTESGNGVSVCAPATRVCERE